MHPERASREAGQPHICVLAGLARSLIIFRGPLLQAMRSAGCRVTAVAGDDDRQVAGALAKDGVDFRTVKLARAGLNPLADLATFVALMRLFRTTRPDVFLGYTIKPATYGVLAARLAGVPRRYALITGLGYAFTEGPELTRRLSRLIAGALYRLALRFADRVIFQNPDDEAFFVARGYVRAAQAARVNGSGVDLRAFAQEPLQPGPLTFLMIARLLRDKGVYEYAAAARLVRQQHPDARFLLIGPLDPNPSGVKASEVDAWVREGVVDYRGEVADVRPHLRECHVYVLPTWYREGVPRTVLEAMATGRAIITCDTPGARETVAGGNGTLVPPRDAGALAQAMLSFASDPDRVAAAGQRSRELAAARFDVDAVNQAMLRILLPV